MNKKELVARIAQSTGLPQAQVARALDCTINIIQETLEEGDKKSSRALDSTINIIRDELVDKPSKKAAKALDSTIHLHTPEQVDASYNKPKALDSTIDLIDPALVESGKKSNRALDSTINLVPDHVVDAGKVSIHGFGTFYTTQRKARIGRNPRTGAEVKIKARIVPKFKFSKQLVDRIN